MALVEGNELNCQNGGFGLRGFADTFTADVPRLLSFQTAVLYKQGRLGTKG